MINTGAIALCTLIEGDFYNIKFARLLELARYDGSGVFAPALDKHGNSVAGVQVLVKLSQAMDLSIY